MGHFLLDTQLHREPTHVQLIIFRDSSTVGDPVEEEDTSTSSTVINAKV